MTERFGSALPESRSGLLTKLREAFAAWGPQLKKAVRKLCYGR